MRDYMVLITDEYTNVDNFLTFNTLPNIKYQHDKFFEYKRDNEHLGVIKLNKIEMDLWTTNHLPNDIIKYFQVGINLDVDWGTLDFKSDNYNKYQNTLEAYIKCVWLTKDFVINNGFKNPVGAYWNPRNSNWTIHPGMARQKILFLFGGDIIEVLGFNTGGKKTIFEKKFNSINEIMTHFNNDDVFLIMVADHGSLIPHVHFDQKTMIGSIEECAKKTKYFFENNIITSNFNLDYFGYIPPVKGNNVKITIENPNDVKQIIMSLLLAPSFGNFDNYGVKIEQL